MPWACICSSSQVKFSLVVAFPIHHQRVWGRQSVGGVRKPACQRSHVSSPRARAGASTLAEFPIARLPSVLVPLPISGGHQFPNAQKLADCGGAVIIRDEALSEELLPILNELLADENRRLQMGADAAALAVPQAGLNIAQAIVRLGSPA